jgi:hypothetical protein
MRLPLSTEDQEKLEKFAELATIVKQQQSEKLHERLSANPFPTLEENALGAFLEMYEPHLVPIVMAFLEKGHLVEPTSGFAKEHPECQMLFGQFSLEEKIINSFSKIGVMVHKETNKKYIKFYPSEAKLEAILRMYEQILNILPPHTGDIEISQTQAAKKFRRTYTPQDSKLKHTRLFEILMYEVHERVSVEVVKRLRVNPKPTPTELNLGAFVEMIEPQVRDAILEFNRKGYSTDVSGFMGRSDMQWIEGDFSVDEILRQRLESEGVSVVTNHSGYTSIQFQPKEANFDKIHQKWMRISGLLPDRKAPTSPSMTVKAREFRKKYTQNVNR